MGNYWREWDVHAHYVGLILERWDGLLVHVRLAYLRITGAAGKVLIYFKKATWCRQYLRADMLVVSRVLRGVEWDDNAIDVISLDESFWICHWIPWGGWRLTSSPTLFLLADLTICTTSPCARNHTRAMLKKWRWLTPVSRSTELNPQFSLMNKDNSIHIAGLIMTERIMQVCEGTQRSIWRHTWVWHWSVNSLSYS